jgi:hypothetical protein
VTDEKTPWRYRALGRGFAIADALAPAALLPRLEAETLIAAAGVTPSAEAREGLQQLMAALAKDSELTLFGRLSVRWDMIRLLRNAAAVEAAHECNPALAAAGIETPIFILGLPRSGTTFLHTLLAEDPDNLVPRNWQTIYPAPRPPGFNPAGDRRVRIVNRQLNLFDGLAPGFSDLHPVTADSPQECSEITSHVFQSLRFDTTFRVPGYLAWLESHGDLAAFRFHKRFLQFLQDGQPGNWVLKCPDHTFSLDAILQTYPDARFVVVHRDPMDVLSSVAHLTEILRKPFLKNIDPAEIGDQVSARWIDGAARLIAFDHRADISADRKIHLRHDDLIAAPLAAAAAIYNRFGLPLAATAEAAMARLLAAKPRGGYARHAPYAGARFGLSPDRMQAAFAHYVARYCAPIETVTGLGH